MKNVLVLAYSFLPNDNAGVRRPAGLYHYLPQFDWQPIILTRSSHQSDYSVEYEFVYRTKYVNLTGSVAQFVRNSLNLGANEPIRTKLNIESRIAANPSYKNRVYSLVQDLITFPDVAIGWYPYCLREADKLLANLRIEAIISTSEPITSHLVARTLKVRHPHLKWVADFRDLWSLKHSRDLTSLRTRLDRRTEAVALSTASAITTVSNPFADQMRMAHPERMVVTIPNGFDPAEYEGVSGTPPTDRLVITHAGHIYQGFRDPTPLFRVVSELIKENQINREKIELRFYGYTATWLDELVIANELTGSVIVSERLPREDILRELKSSSLLLLLDWLDPRELGNVPAKLFEYMGCQRPIIAIGGSSKGSVAQILDKTGAGVHITHEEKLKSTILSYYEWQVNQGVISFEGNPQEIFHYTQEKMAQRFAELLDKARP